MTEEHEYILGTDRDELERLRFQHQAWVKQAYALFERAGIRTGDVVVDLGCGPGFTSFELAHVVGQAGKVIARDESARFLDHLRAERDRLGYTQVETSLGPVEQLDLPPDYLDAAYARWLLCWLPDPGAALERVTRSLKRGGVIVLQEYWDWGAMKLAPRSEAFERIVAACMHSWKVGGATIDIGERIPSLAAECGLAIDLLRPRARIGAVGSLEWRWLTEFFASYLPRLVELDLLEPAQLDAYREDWERRAADGKSYCYTPTMVDVILRRR